MPTLSKEGLGIPLRRQSREEVGLTSLPARKPGLSDLHVRGAGLSEKQLQAGECVLRNLASNKTLFLARRLQLKRPMDKASSDKTTRRYNLAGVLLNRI